ncbi:MAG: aminopeptidase, partial [Telluria sp.]
MRLPFGLVALCLATSAIAADPPNSGFDDKFRQLDELLPTPTTIRTASGAPGHAYWQQRADYTIRATLDEAHRSISGSETINYHNHSPDTLNYLWVQLDQNIFKPDSDARTTATVASRDAWGKPRGPEDGMKFDSMRNMLEARTFDGGFKIASVKDGSGRPLHYVINRTMMRIDLPQPLKAGGQVAFSIEWSFNIPEQKVIGGRSGYEKFDDKNDLFEVAQWFPRMAAYYDVYGWQHKQFL